MDAELRKGIAALNGKKKEIRILLNRLPQGMVSDFLEAVFAWVVRTSGDRRILTGASSATAIGLCGSILRRMDIDVGALVAGYSADTCNRAEARKDLENRVKDDLSRLEDLDLPVYSRGLVYIIREHCREAKGDSPGSLAVLHLSEKFFKEIV